jgi:hypothetical protein
MRLKLGKQSASSRLPKEGKNRNRGPTTELDLILSGFNLRANWRGDEEREDAESRIYAEFRERVRRFEPATC